MIKVVFSCTWSLTAFDSLLKNQRGVISYILSHKDVNGVSLRQLNISLNHNLRNKKTEHWKDISQCLLAITGAFASSYDELSGVEDENGYFGLGHGIGEAWEEFRLIDGGCPIGVV